MKVSRIWTTFDQNGAMGGVWRVLHRITRNEFDDYLFQLDGGEVWQFTTKDTMETAPTVENVAQLGIGQDSKTKKPLPFMCFLVLKNNEHCTGNLRIIPPKSEAAQETTEPKKNGRPRRDWDADDLIVKRWNDARAVAGVTYETFLSENPDIFKGKGMVRRVQELKRLISAASKRR